MSDNAEHPTEPTEHSPTEPSGQPESSGSAEAPSQPAPSGEPTQRQPSPADRPKPEFGEYAPEGWTWTPEGTDSAAAQSVEHRASSGAPEDTPVGGPIPGVPHNLGARHAPQGAAGKQSAPDKQAAPDEQAARSANATPTTPPEGPAANAPGSPYRATPPQFGESAPTGGPGQAGPPAQPTPLAAPPSVSPTGVSAAAKPRTGDRVVTIVLLVIGALSALSIAQSMMSLPMSLTVIAQALDLEGFSVPGWVTTLGTASAIGVIAIYAVTLIYSIQRMRARKLTFWVPLTVGVIVAIIVLIITMSVIFTQPQLMEAMEDPDAMNRMFEYLSGTQSTLP